MKRATHSSLAAFFLLTLAGPVWAQGEPPLPSGLDRTPAEDDEPPVPTGLEDAAPADEPSLPSGLDGSGPTEEIAKDNTWLQDLPIELSGFWEARGGLRMQSDPFEKDESLGETRLQLRAETTGDTWTIRLSGDLVYDPIVDERDVRLESGSGVFDLREASVLFSPLSFLDIKTGRQILTWGTGDLIFINDLFPKDWNAFLIGRDMEYLKAPSDAVKLSLFSEAVNLDLVYTPRFDADRFIDGSRLSFYNAQLGRLSGRDAPVEEDRLDEWLDDDELAVRLHRTLGSNELVAYAYRGFWKSPGGFDPGTGRATFPALSVYGASVRGSVGGGIGYAEAGYYNSEDDQDGDDPLVRNGELRLLVGFQRELVKDTTIGLQYYVEHMLDYDEYRRTLPPGSPAADEDRHVITLRLTRMLLRQDLRLSLFVFYSPSDYDAYLRPHAHFKLNDAWTVELGGNVFLGEDDHTFFGQFENNTNVYTGVRYSY